MKFPHVPPVKQHNPPPVPAVTTIPIENIRGAFIDCEPCALCGTPTLAWTTLPDRAPGEQVACCIGCATTRAPDDVPTKRAWCDAARSNGRPIMTAVVIRPSMSS